MSRTDLKCSDTVANPVSERDISPRSDTASILNKQPAVSHYESSVSQDPDAIGRFLRQSRLHLLTSGHQQALKYAEAALAVDGNSSEAWFLKFCSILHTDILMDRAVSCIPGCRTYVPKCPADDCRLLLESFLFRYRTEEHRRIMSSGTEEERLMLSDPQSFVERFSSIVNDLSSDTVPEEQRKFKLTMISVAEELFASSEEFTVRMALISLLYVFSRMIRHLGNSIILPRELYFILDAVMCHWAGTILAAKDRISDSGFLTGISIMTYISRIQWETWQELSATYTEEDNTSSWNHFREHPETWEIIDSRTEKATNEFCNAMYGSQPKAKAIAEFRDEVRYIILATLYPERYSI